MTSRKAEILNSIVSLSESHLGHTTSEWMAAQCQDHVRERVHIVRSEIRE